MRRDVEMLCERPGDGELVLELGHRLEHNPALLPNGDRLHPRRLRQLGNVLGMSDGAERLHYLLELEPDSQAFLHDAQQMAPFARNQVAVR
jgi:hypothetical protein